MDFESRWERRQKMLVTDDLKIRGVHFAEVGVVTSPWESVVILVTFALIFRFVLYLALRWRKMTQWRQASGEVATKRGVARFMAKLKAFLQISSFARITDTHDRGSGGESRGRRSGFGGDIDPVKRSSKQGGGCRSPAKQSSALQAALSKNISSATLGRNTDRNQRRNA